jgi:CHAT domain-containing protein/tetratricopeptide (TPR) repeat protein
MLFVFGLSGCHVSGSPQPEALFRSIYSDYVHGALDAARARAAAAREEFSAGNPGGNPSWELKFRLLEAEILLKQNRWEGVIALLTSGASFPRTGDLATKWNLLCSRAHYSLGRSREADQELREARRLAESGHSALIGDVLRAEALVQRDSGNWGAAIEKFTSSLAAAREHGDAPLEAADLVELGFANLQIGHFDQAVVLSQEAASFSRSIQANRQIQFALGNAGWAYENLGDFENALSNFQAAEQQAKEIGMISLRVLWLQDAGLVEYKLGNFEEARRYDEEAIKSALTLPAVDEVEQIVNIQTNLGLLLYRQGQYDAAKTYSDAAMASASESKDVNVVAYALFVRGLVAAREANAPDAQRLLTQAGKMTTDLEIRMDVENALANLYSDRREPRQSELWHRRSIQTFESKRSLVHNETLRLSAFAYGDAIYRDYASFLIDSHRPIEALRLLDRSRARTLEEGLGFTSVEADAQGTGVADPQAVARKLNAPIFFYSLGPEKSYLWVTTAHETRLFTLPKQRVIQTLVEEYLREIQKSTDPLQTAAASASSLYDVLVKPAAAMIPNASKIFILPDGVLHELNFETLLEPTADGFKYWIEDVTVTISSSIRMLSRLSATSSKAATRDLLLIGDPVQAIREFEPLPNASAEMQRIERHFPPDGQMVLGQSRAVPAAYAVSGPEQFRYIHFVAHGTASRSSPLDSAVILSPAPNDPEDFKLYARDIVQHSLNARLVTISACYGSGLRTYAGEGLVGLAWAFLRAGAHNVIGALWQADDAATPPLMDRLYGELAAGATPDAALRTAKLSLIHSSSVYRKPLYWAAFQLYAGS